MVDTDSVWGSMRFSGLKSKLSREQQRQRRHGNKAAAMPRTIRRRLSRNASAPASMAKPTGSRLGPQAEQAEKRWQEGKIEEYRDQHARHRR